ncbi:MAG: ABC transporter permease [Bacteroidetes bacterium]|nr:ABC transporter permease [Bacteroidota bacterium]
MITNSIGATLSYFKKHRSLLAINLIGLTTSLAVCYFAFVYVQFELSYDSYHIHSENIYRLVTDVKSSSGIDYRGSSVALGPAVKETFPEVKASTRILLDYLIIQNEKGLQYEEKIAYADSTLFSVFTFPLVQGNAAKVLNAPFEIVLSQSCAEKYFGADNPIGKMLLINGKDRAYVTGVMKDIPSNSHFKVDMLLSLSTLLKVWNPSMEDNWKGLRANTYLLLHANSDPVELNAKINTLVKSKVDQKEVQYLTSLEPLREVYLHGKPRGSRSGSAVTGNITNLYVCSWAAALVLFIACLNFINLSTAFSMQRAKEIGVRKLLGASRSALIIQFLTDALVISVIAFVLSLALISFTIPIFNEVAGKTILLGLSQHIVDIGLLLLVSVATGLLSGIYPAFFLSAFQPIDSLKGRFTSSIRGIRLRKVLVTSQFLISFMLIVATTVLYSQLDYMQNQELGFKKDHMMAIDFQFDTKAGSEFTRLQLLTIPGVSQASISSSLPGKPNHKLETRIKRADGAEELSNYDAYFADYNFLEQYGLSVIAGRPFSLSIASDSTQAMMINEAAVKKLGYNNPEDAVGKPYAQWGREGVIIGVVKDFHFQSFREEVQPLTFQIGAISTFMTLTISQTNMQSTIRAVEDKWKSIVPDIPISYFFTDEAYHAQYESDRRFGKLFLCLVAMAIVISCLGLLGLSVFSTLQRTKEIGIRKVLGSSVAAILIILTKDFFVLIARAVAIGIPLSWYVMNKWLEGFAYRVNLTAWIFLFAILMLTLIALATIGYQTLKAAYTDPVKSLKTE